MILFRSLTVTGLACIASLCIVGTADAQSNSLFGSSGPLATTGGGRSSTGSTFGSASGATGLAQGQTGGNALGTQVGSPTQLGQLSSTIGGGFVGRGDNTGRLVGQTASGQGGAGSSATTSFRGVTGTGGRGQTGARGNFGGQLGAGRGLGQQSTTAGREAIRPVTVIAFNYTRRTVARVNTNLTTRFVRLSVRSSRFRSVAAVLNSQSDVVLTGTVDSQSTKTLAENIARMEPGVRRVVNQLVVRK